MNWLKVLLTHIGLKMEKLKKNPPKLVHFFTFLEQKLPRCCMSDLAQSILYVRKGLILSSKGHSHFRYSLSCRSIRSQKCRFRQHQSCQDVQLRVFPLTPS